MKNIFYMLVFLLAGGILFQSCGKKEEAKTDTEKKLQPVKIREVVGESFQESYKVVAIVKPFESAKISSEEGGLITYQPFDKGSRIGKGQTAVRLRKDQDIAAYDQAATQFELATSNFNRMEKLYNEDVATEQDYTNAKFQLELAEKSLDVLETRLEKSYVTSPISGIVDQKYLGKGEVCGPGTPILNVVNVSRVKIAAGIPESYISEIKKGSPVKITFDVYPGEEFTGNVSYIAPTLSPTNRTFEVEVVLNNGDGRLKPEMSANFEIEKLRIDNAVILPQDLIVDFGSEKFVFVLENDIVKKKIINLGGRKDNNVLITSGLNEGEKLVIEGFQSLTDGDKVLVIN